jgi:hypothetical protein
MFSGRVLTQHESHMGRNEMVHTVDDDARVGELGRKERV